jgi:hypothetical protein
MTAAETTALELAFREVWVVPPVDGLPLCAICLFWRDPDLGPRIGIMCGPAVELGQWDESTEVGCIVAAWRRLLARMGRGAVEVR